MPRTKALSHLLFIFILLAASIQATQSSELIPQKNGGVYTNPATQVQGRKITKYPSGPNPTGNRHSPSRP
ncbi:hypothetical protein ACHQM5_021409 [Ranunculus cassubicifolius]